MYSSALTDGVCVGVCVFTFALMDGWLGGCVWVDQFKCV